MRVNDIINNKPYLAWDIKDASSLSDESILEHILNYGNWDDVQMYIKIKGMFDTKKNFNKLLDKKRVNLFPEIKHYFTIYFDKYA
jgi:hypothetical protein